MYIISQTKFTTNISVWRSGLKTWFHADCCHRNYQNFKQNLFFVLWLSLKMFCNAYCQLQVNSNYFCLVVKLENIIPWRLLVTTIYILVVQVSYTWVKTFFVLWLGLKTFCSSYYQATQFDGLALKAWFKVNKNFRFFRWNLHHKKN